MVHLKLQFSKMNSTQIHIGRAVYTIAPARQSNRTVTLAQPNGETVPLNHPSVGGKRLIRPLYTLAKKTIATKIVM